MEKGKVIDIKGKKAVVEIKKTEKCGDCHACGVFDNNKGMMIVELNNELGLKKGDTVTIDVTESQRIIASAVVYLLPILMMFIGFIIGYFIISIVIPFDKQAIAILSAFVLFFLSFWIIATVEKKNEKYFTPVMVKKD